METAATMTHAFISAVPSAEATIRGLLSAAAVVTPAADAHGETSNATTAGADHGCFPHINHGTELQHKIAVGLQWFTVIVAIVQLIFYGWHSFKATTGWEEVYVCVIELVKCFIELFHEVDSPATVYQTNGGAVIWLRYSMWLLTCPVILIHLSNLTGLHEEYSKRTMTILVTDIGNIVWGITAAFTKGPLKILFFMIGLFYGVTCFFQIAKVYIESYHTLPKGVCRKICKIMAYVFFCSWLMFPVMFIAGHEGLGLITPYTSGIGHLILDLISKNTWGFLGHHLRVKIHEHILIHGDIRKTTTINVAGENMEIETFVDEEEEGGV
nr:Chronos [synthetic construct]